MPRDGIFQIVGLFWQIVFQIFQHGRDLLPQQSHIHRHVFDKQRQLFLHNRQNNQQRQQTKQHKTAEHNHDGGCSGMKLCFKLRRRGIKKIRQNNARHKRQQHVALHIHAREKQQENEHPKNDFLRFCHKYSALIARRRASSSCRRPILPRDASN